MPSRSRWLNTASWLMPVAVVLIAVGLDRWVEALRKEASASFNFASAAWAGLGANLVVTALLLLLAWLIAFRRGRTRGPAAICLLLGVLVAVYPWFFMLAGEGVPQVFVWPPLRNLRAILMGSGLSSRSMLASHFLALSGLVGLIFTERRAD